MRYVSTQNERKADYIYAGDLGETVEMNSPGTLWMLSEDENTLTVASRRGVETLVLLPDDHMNEGDIARFVAQCEALAVAADRFVAEMEFGGLTDHAGTGYSRGVAATWRAAAQLIRDL